jgi:hypothetical protein
MTFLENLRAQGSGYQILASQCKLTETPIFMDLCWGEELDIWTIVGDPGIQLDKGSRRFVFARVAGEIRYYAGPSEPNDEKTEIEVGVFPSIPSALAFGYEWLLRGCGLSEIGAERRPRSVGAS